MTRCNLSFLLPLSVLTEHLKELPDILTGARYLFTFRFCKTMTRKILFYSFTCKSSLRKSCRSKSLLQLLVKKISNYSIILSKIRIHKLLELFYLLKYSVYLSIHQLVLYIFRQYFLCSFDLCRCDLERIL